MIGISRYTHPNFRPFVAVVLAMAISGCANNGQLKRSESRQSEPVAQHAVPDYVRNLPKSLTGNMSEYTVFGRRYSVLDSAAGFTEQGTASWYGKKFHGRKTSSGEIYDMHSLTAAHKHLPLPTYVRVTNLENNYSVVVKVNDRGPFVGDRIIDLSLAAAMELDMKEQGTANVHIEALSTHLVAENAATENDNTSSQAVVASNETLTNESETNAPELIEPVLAAVPLQEPAIVIEQFETEVEPAEKGDLSLPADIASEIGNSNEGYVELDAKADTALVAAPTVEQPSEAPQMAAASQLEVANTIQGSEGGYFIQLGAFAHAPNAEALVDDVVRKIGLTAFIEKDEMSEIYRVKMGPYEKGDKLETTMTELADIGIESYPRQAVDR